MDGLAITGYKYSLSVSTNNGSTYGSYGADVLSSWTSGTSFVITGLTNGYYYKIKIRAVNSLGDGAQAAEIGPYVPNTVPGTPSTISGNSGSNQQTFISWGTPSNGGSTITDYVIQYSTSASFASGITTWSHAASASSSATITGLTNGTPLYFRVAAINNGTNGGTGPYSAISAAFTPYTVPGTPGVPTIVWGTGSSTSDTASWTAASNNGNAIDQYEVITSSNGFAAYDSYANITTLSKAIDNGYTNTGRNVAVRAHNAAGWGSYSAGSPGTIGSWTSNYNSSGDSETQTQSYYTGCNGSDNQPACGTGQYCECGAQYAFRTRSRIRYRSTQYWSRSGNDNSSTTYGSFGSDATFSAWSYTGYGGYSACDATGTQNNVTGSLPAFSGGGGTEIQYYSSNRGPYPFYYAPAFSSWIWGNTNGTASIGCGGGCCVAGPSVIYQCSVTGTITTNDGTTVADQCNNLFW